MKIAHKYYSIVLLVFCLYACKSEPTAKEKPAEPEMEVKGATPITLTEPMLGNMSDSVVLNATSAFLLKSFVKSNANGYLQLVNAELGKQVFKGQELFIVKTKESQSLGNTINALDSSLHFEGNLHIKSPGSGYISQLNYRSGDYVQDGEQLATITDTKSFVFILSLPYELKPFLKINQTLQLVLPDATKIDGYVAMAMPTVDSISQTQNHLIRIHTDRAIPENLIAKVTLIKHIKSNTVSLLKSAVLSDETQSQFWIMKMIDSVTAVKVMVTKGMETNDKVEILSPRLLKTDKILLTGNYGLPDTAKVEVTK
jgi:biotin carboxyl carrier protein